MISAIIRYCSGWGLTRLFFASMLVIAVTACSKESPKLPTPEEEASAMAQQCYEALYGGNEEWFLSQRMHADEMTQDYRNQLLIAYRQHVTRVNDEHRGVSSIQVTGAHADSTLQIVQVLLMLSYADSTKEEIVVPMVQKGQQWMLK